MVQIKHLSVSVNNPERAAKILAEITSGEAQSFTSRSMTGAWVCMWDEKSNHLIEFLPKNYLMFNADFGADFKLMTESQNFNSTHFLLETDVALDKIKTVAEKHDCKHQFRARFGGPLYDVWFEEQFLVEFVSDEIKALA